MKRMSWLPLLLLALALCGCEGGNDPTGGETSKAETREAEISQTPEESEWIPENEPEDIEVTTAAAGDTADPEAVEEAMVIVRDTVEAVNSYGVVDVGNETVDGSSLLSFDFQYENLMITEEGYIADVTLAHSIEIPADLQVGEVCSLVINELTGENLKITRISENEYAREGEEDWPCYVSADSTGALHLYEGSDDRVDCPFYQGKLMVRRDAQYCIPIMGESRTITEADFNEFDEGHLWSNGVWLSEAGEVTKVCYFGD